MNRIRHAYLELAPELGPYFVTSTYDDETGVRLSGVGMRRPFPRVQPLITVPGVVALVDSVVAGAACAIVGLGLDLALAWRIVLGCVGFVLSFVFFLAWARRWIASFRNDLVVRFPTPPPAG
jgi:hypothetical protein